MRLFRHNRPSHSLLLMPVRLGNERWPNNKVRLLSCDAEGHLFTQLVGRSTYQRIIRETQQMEVSKNNYATLYIDTGGSKFEPLLVEIGSKEAWALERVLENALIRVVIPAILTRYLKEIIKLGESKRQGLLIVKTREAHQTVSAASSRILDRLPYYRKQDVEISIPIYKVEYAFPLIILQRLPKAKDTSPGQQRLLVLDSDGDLGVTTLSLEQISKAKGKLNDLQRKGKAGYLICLRKPEGVAVDSIEVTELQRQALETVTRYFEETGQGKQPFPEAIRKVLQRARETVLS